MCNHQNERLARVCECGAFIPASEPETEHKVRHYSRPTNIMAGVPRRPVWKADDDLDYPLGVFDYTRLDTVRPSYDDDAGGSFDNARRAREDDVH